MLKPEWPLDKGLPPELPWHGSVSLLLDGVSVEKLPQQLFQWSQSPDFEPLYLCTRWAELGDISPCLVNIEGQQNPILAQFLANASKEWGYLLFSDAPWRQIIEHLRWLTSVRHPQGEEVLLRLADPAVAHALLSHGEQLKDPTLFGPCTQILTADAAAGVWHLHHRPGLVPAPHHDQPYRLSDEQLSLLNEVSFRGVVMRLDEHMQEYFPAYRAHATPRQRWEHLHQLASHAYERGFASELDITLYANIHGFLGERALEEHPDLDARLKTPSAHTPAQRLEQVADIAMQRAQHLQRNQG
ncbi:hypothetical protein JM49_02250 [Pseudomonas chlororaphis subsp. aurantiaca]|uniref:DUF4123 domain-containing protein n=1 Tax=Pseudomonas chlororaphis TaxID=587753 RepID=UPI00050D829C|nr:DUF4123 domain-containing protein [Pseudomonas chlororaphis]AIS10532.1 hypothetical protein JM49_02250 [Pseudomonas chlororaphis subsp. aurantiaca]